MMEHTWQLFEGWLAQHWLDGLACLNPPASDAQIAQLEAQLAVKLPADFIACLRVHNGQSGSASLFDGMEFLSCEEIYRQWQVWQGLLDGGDFDDITSEPDEGIKDDWWNAKWVPFTHNGSGDHLCLDLDPDESGAVGQVISMWHDMEARELKAASFGEYFQAYVSDLLAGAYVYAEAYGGIIKADEV